MAFTRPANQLSVASTYAGRATQATVTTLYTYTSMATLGEVEEALILLTFGMLDNQEEPQSTHEGSAFAASGENGVSNHYEHCSTNNRHPA